MAKRDITGEAVTRLRARLGRVQERMSDKITLGPNKQQLTPREIRLELQKMDPATKTRIIQGAGPEEWTRLMENLYNG